MLILHLETGLYPDFRTVSEALPHLEVARPVQSIDLRRPGMADRDWDGVIDAILAVDLVICG